MFALSSAEDFKGKASGAMQQHCEAKTIPPYVILAVFYAEHSKGEALSEASEGCAVANPAETIIRLSYCDWPSRKEEDECQWQKTDLSFSRNRLLFLFSTLLRVYMPFRT